MTDVTPRTVRSARAAATATATVLGLVATVAAAPAVATASAFVGAASVVSTQLSRVTVAPAAPEVYPVPPSGTFTIRGRGYGHAHGMSQWGAYGAAKVDHLSSNQILHFYYPHTTLATRSTATLVKVLLTAVDAPSRGYVQVAPAPGLALTGATGPASILPTTTATKKKITAWRLQTSGTGAAETVELRDEVAGAWHAVRSSGRVGTFADTASEIAVSGPDGPVTYRGELRGALEAGQLEAVNIVDLELYLRSVVPAEMSSSWTSAALQAQAVAARTYARRDVAHPKASWFDLYADTRDQAYLGLHDETTRTNNAIAATAGEVVVDPTGHVILAQYSASDGGWTVSGGEPYLPSRADPYDGLVPNSSNAWTSAVTAATIAAAYPQIGALRSITITARDGNGLWGGRVTTVHLVGTDKTVSVSGIDLQLALGLRSYWFQPVPTPGPPTSSKATEAAGTVTVTWKAPTAISGAAAVSGYVVRLSPGAHRVAVGPGSRTTSVTKLAAGTYTVTVSAQSVAGSGPVATVSVTVPKT